MKRLLLASLFLLLPLTTQAGFPEDKDGYDIEKIEMASIEQCEEEIKKLLMRWDMKEKHGQDQFACVTGK